MGLSERRYLYPYRCLRCERPVTPDHDLCLFCARDVAAIADVPTVPLHAAFPDPLDRLRVMRVRAKVRAGTYTDWPYGKPLDGPCDEPSDEPCDEQEQGGTDNGQQQ